jgi:hypothetical protein
MLTTVWLLVVVVYHGGVSNIATFTNEAACKNVASQYLKSVSDSRHISTSSDAFCLKANVQDVILK